MSPSIDTLNAVLESLGTTLSGFFSDLRSTHDISSFYKAEDLVEIGRSDGVSHRVVGANHSARSLLLLHERYAPGAKSASTYSHMAQEGGVVIKGAIELTVGEHTRILKPGDGYYFDSATPHRFANACDGESEIVSAVTPPTY